MQIVKLTLKLRVGYRSEVSISALTFGIIGHCSIDAPTLFSALEVETLTFSSALGTLGITKELVVVAASKTGLVKAEPFRVDQITVKITAAPIKSSSKVFLDFIFPVLTFLADYKNVALSTLVSARYQIFSLIITSFIQQKRQKFYIAFII